MSAAERKLRSVTALPLSLESELRELFRREADNAREAVAIRQSLAAARRRLAERDRLIIFPSMDTLRDRLGQ